MKDSTSFKKWFSRELNDEGLQIIDHSANIEITAFYLCVFKLISCSSFLSKPFESKSIQSI